MSPISLSSIYLLQSPSQNSCSITLTKHSQHSQHPHLHHTLVTHPSIPRKTALPSQHAVPYFPVYFAPPELCRRPKQHHFRCQRRRFDREEYIHSSTSAIFDNLDTDLKCRSMVSRRDGQLPHVMWWPVTDQS